MVHSSGVACRLSVIDDVQTFPQPMPNAENAERAESGERRAESGARPREILRVGLAT